MLPMAPGLMVSAAVGSVGATSAQIPESWWVRNDFSVSASSPGFWAASWMVWDGNRCSMMATSPKWKSRSTRATSAPPRLRATARLVDRNVLPQPPLELKTVATLPGARPSPASVGAPPLSRPRRVLAISIALAADQQHRHVGGALLEGVGQGEGVAVGQARPEDGRQHVLALGGHGGHGLVGVGGADHPVG